MEAATLLSSTHLFLRLLLGCILLCSGLAKLAHPHNAAHAIRDYKIFPSALEAHAAFWLVPAGLFLAEITAGLGLISGFLLTLAVILTSILLVIFSCAIIMNLVRGRRDLSCHCAGVLGEHRISWWLVGRNTFLLAGTLLILMLPPDPFTLGHSPTLNVTAWINTALPIALIVGALLVVFVLVNAARMLRT